MIRTAIKDSGVYFYRNGEELRNLHNSLDDEAFLKASLREDLCLDSLDIVDMISYLENQGFSFDNDELGKCQTVSDLINLAQVK